MRWPHWLRHDWTNWEITPVTVYRRGRPVDATWQMRSCRWCGRTQTSPLT